jgi:RNA polymerase sigma factor (sigma-70 family)
MSVMVQRSLNMLEMTESTLLEAARDGDGKAYASLVEAHLPLLYRIAFRACGDGFLAEDAVQETLTIAYQKLGAYRPGTSMKAFLAGIAVKRAHTLFRAEKRRRERERHAPIPEHSATPEQMMRVSAMAAEIRDALSALPKKRREAAILRLEGKLDDTEIATALGSSPGSVRVLVHHALEELRRRLGLDEGGG